MAIVSFVFPMSDEIKVFIAEYVISVNFDILHILFNPPYGERLVVL